MSTWTKLSLFVALAATLAPQAAAEGHRHGAAKARHFGRAAPNPNKAVIVQMFQWSWDSIAAECTNFLGPAGYGYVQGASRSAWRRRLSSYYALYWGPTVAKLLNYVLTVLSRVSEPAAGERHR